MDDAPSPAPPSTPPLTPPNNHPPTTHHPPLTTRHPPPPPAAHHHSHHSPACRPPGCRRPGDCVGRQERRQLHRAHPDLGLCNDFDITFPCVSPLASTDAATVAPNLANPPRGVSRSRNTKPEYLFISVLPATTPTTILGAKGNRAPDFSPDVEGEHQKFPWLLHNEKSGLLAVIAFFIRALPVCCVQNGTK